MIHLLLLVFVPVWLSMSARKLEQNAFLWAAVGMASYLIPVWIGKSVIEYALPRSPDSFKSIFMIHVALGYLNLAVAMVCVIVARQQLIARVIRQGTDDGSAEQ